MLCSLEHFNTCRAAGVQGSNTDFLICAAAERRQFSILTTGRDFVRYAEPPADHVGPLAGASPVRDASRGITTARGPMVRWWDALQRR